MADNSNEGSYIQLTANIVSAYVSNNSVSSAEIPGLISQSLFGAAAHLEW